MKNQLIEEVFEMDNAIFEKITDPNDVLFLITAMKPEGDDTNHRIKAAVKGHQAVIGTVLASTMIRDKAVFMNIMEAVGVLAHKNPAVLALLTAIVTDASKPNTDQIPKSNIISLNGRPSKS